MASTAGQRVLCVSPMPSCQESSQACIRCGGVPTKNIVRSSAGTLLSVAQGGDMHSPNALLRLLKPALMSLSRTV